MEKEIFNLIKWSKKIPSKEGLYLFNCLENNIESKLETEECEQYDSKRIHFVYIKKQQYCNNTYFKCYSATFPTEYNLNCLPFEGVWSNRINFE
jgi:hypothetical protein